jgi:hypothetical protein
MTLCQAAPGGRGRMRIAAVLPRETARQKGRKKFPPVLCVRIFTNTFAL